jgi:hypothetical protein
MVLKGVVIEVKIWHKPLLKTNMPLLLLLSCSSSIFTMNP